MSHQMKQTNHIELPSDEDNNVRHLRCRLPHHMFPYPQVSRPGVSQIQTSPRSHNILLPGKFSVLFRLFSSSTSYRSTDILLPTFKDAN